MCLDLTHELIAYRQTNQKNITHFLRHKFEVRISFYVYQQKLGLQLDFTTLFDQPKTSEEMGRIIIIRI